LRICATGGTRVPAALGETFRKRGLVLQPGYGLSEAAPLVAVVDHAEVGWHPDGVGRPALFTDVRVVDASLQDVAAGEPGELLVRGLNVTPGYVDNPGATTRAQTPDGWFRTGDAATMSEGGTISVLGRLADALVVAGRTVYPEPIEEALRGEPGVEACLLVQHAPSAEPVLWIVPSDAAGIDEPRLLARVQALGLAITPRLRLTDALPRNANGKPIRNALRALGAEAA
jgi:fatty-acyl-CoA synthase